MNILILSINLDVHNDSSAVAFRGLILPPECARPRAQRAWITIVQSFVFLRKFSRSQGAKNFEPRINTDS
jgi:hypothetical protein